MSTATSHKLEFLRTLPSDAVRQIQWNFANRYDLQMLVQSARGVARGPVAKLVAQGGRNSHEWTPAKAELLEAFDRSGITAVFMDPEQEDSFSGPRTWRLPSSHSSLPGWMVEQPPPAWRVASRWHRFTSAALRSSRNII